MSKYPKIKSSIKIPGLILLICWLSILTETLFDIKFYYFGTSPREASGLIGIITSPFIHGDFDHLISNTFPFFVLCTSVFYFHKKYAVKNLIFNWLFTGIIVWIFARESYHIGISGLVYAFASFFFFNGIFFRNMQSITLSVIVIFLYGGLTLGLFPSDAGVSWESHLGGVISGLLSVFFFRDDSNIKKYDWEDEDISHLPPPEISYKKGFPFD